VSITTFCPVCHTRYQLKEELRGRQIRCVTPDCRTVFTVREEEKPPPSSADSQQAPKNPPPGGKERRSRIGASKTGTVGELVPILPAEITLAPEEMPEPAAAENQASGQVGETIPLVQVETEPAPAAPEAEPSWQNPPPVRRSQTSTPTPPSKANKPPESGRRSRTAAPKTSLAPDQGNKSGSIHVPPPEPNSAPAANGLPESRPADWESPPPVRIPGAEAPKPHSDPAAIPHPEAPQVDNVADETPLYPSATRSRLVLWGLVVFTGLILVGGVVTAMILFHVTEDRLFQQADQEFQDHKYADAADKFKKLQEQFSSSDQLEKYALLQELCELLAFLEDTQMQAGDAFVQLQAFLNKHRKNSNLKPYHVNLGQALVRRLTDFGSQAPREDARTPDLVVQAREAVEDVKILPNALTDDDLTKIGQELAAVKRARDLWVLREQYLEQIKQVLARPSGSALRLARRLILAAGDEGLADFRQDKDTALIGLFKQFQQSHLAAVGYQEEKKGLDRAALSEDKFHNLVIDPLLQGVRGDGKDKAIVLALVRGVLYGLQRSTGKVQWATRVGIDTTTLPVRVPATSFNPELILVLSADTQTLTALNSTSETVWQYRLNKPCLGRPVIFEGRAFLPTFDGQVHEIELAKGQLLGRFQLGLGERLTVGGTRQEKSNLVYFPADEGCVYVVDVNEKRCVSILYTGHPSGSLRGEPLVVPPEGPDPGYLILNQTLGLDEMQLRVYPLPLKDPEAAPVSFAPDKEPRVRGWTWFPPYRDEEKIALLSDEGMLGIFGIKQLHNVDPALFPAFPARSQGLSLESFLPVAKGKTRGRSQVVNVQGEDYWVLAHGQMQRLQLAWQNKVGPCLVPGWKAPLVVGSPLHESQVEEAPPLFKLTDRSLASLRASGAPDAVLGKLNNMKNREWPREQFLAELANNLDKDQKERFQNMVLQHAEDLGTARSMLIVVTQVLDRPDCLATAVDDENGLILWQRQLGLVCRGEPILLAPPGGKDLPLLLAMDQGGALLAFDAAAHPRKELGDWQGGGERVADALAENPRFAPLLLRDEGGPGPWKDASGQGAWQAACPGDGLTLVLRRVEWMEKGRKLNVKRELKVTLPAALAGRPVRMGDTLLVLLDNGVVGRVPLKGASVLSEGPNWRAKGLLMDTPGYLLHLHGDYFLTSNGLDGVNCYHWAAGSPDYFALPKRDKPKGEPAPTRRLESRLAAAPLLIPSGKPEAPFVCLAETSGWLKMFQLEKDGQLKFIRKWPIQGRLTGDPFLRILADGSRRIGCVVSGSKLVWLDPDKNEPLWEYKQGGAVSVGQPQLVGDVLVIADQAGRFVGLDPNTGQPAGKFQCTLRGSMAAAASPVPFGPGLAFAPLSDGTVLLLPMDQAPKP
jgi:outer membrane protein assembly factor BamB